MLAELIRQLREGYRFDAIDQVYLHNAVREDGSAVIRGREAIRQAEIASARAQAGPVAVTADLGDMVAWAQGESRAHHWIWRSSERIVREVVVRERTSLPAIAPQSLAPLHGPLGELRAGRGQMAEAAEPPLPPSWPAGAVAHAMRLHRIWNMRALGLIGDHPWSGPGGRAGEEEQHRAWILELLGALPDAVMLFEHAMVGDRSVALLWRLHGHHLGSGFGLPATGRRVRLFGSTILSLAGDAVTAEATVIDEADAIGQMTRPIVDYSGALAQGEGAASV